MTSRAESMLRRAAVMVLIVLALAAAVLACATERSYAAGNFRITDYGIEMTVNEDDTYDIHETIKVEFTAPSHGIYRSVPLRTELSRDGQTSVYYAKIRNFDLISGQPYSNESSDGEMNYKIGDPDKYADTETTYEMSYTYDTGGDHLNHGDELYHNLIGRSWEAQSIDHVSFRITFPKDINMGDVGIKTGMDVKVPFESEGNTVVYGETTENTLGGLTIRATLPDDYFTRQAKTSNVILYVIMALLAVLAAVGIVLWRRYGVDPPIIEPVEFYPPEDLSAPEIGYLSEGEIRGDHVISILLSLADKGYLKIVEKHEKAGMIFKHEKTDYEIVKLKDYDGNVIGERSFMNGLFTGGREKVTPAELSNSFYQTVDSIKDEIRRKYNGKFKDKKADDIASLIRLAGSAGMALLLIASKISNGSPFITDGDFILSIVFLALGVLLPIGGFTIISSRINSVNHGIGGVFVIIGGLFIALFGFLVAYASDVCIGNQVLAYVVGMGFVFFVFIIAALCERKSDFYARILGEIRGYKNFLKTAEKDRLEALAEEDHDFFYKTLAFAFALGVTSVFASKFASLAIKPPEWYESDRYDSDTFSSVTMMNSLNSMMSSASSSMQSSPSDSDGGSGGGSFSGGGGGGGGGGGSW